MHNDLIATALLRIGAVRLSLDPPFTWTSGLRAPMYCDNRMLYGHPTDRRAVVDALVQAVQSLVVPPTVIAGTATAAIGWAALVADRMNLPFVYVRSKPKEHGARKLIEGDLLVGAHVVVVEDLLSTAKSAGATVEALRTEGGATVTDIVSIFSYEFSTAADKAVSLHVALHPLCTLTTLVEIAKKQGRISAADAALIATFSHDPEGWAGRRGSRESNQNIR